MSLQKAVIFFLVLIALFILTLSIIFWKFMNKDFEQISIKPGFMKHNGGLLFKTISENEYQFKTVITENHLNAAGITHGGFISAMVDAGAGTSAHRATGNSPCVTISIAVFPLTTATISLIGEFPNFVNLQ